MSIAPHTAVVTAGGTTWELRPGRARCFSDPAALWVDAFTQDSIAAAITQHESILLEHDREGAGGRRGTHFTIGPILAAYTVEPATEITDTGSYLAVVRRGRHTRTLRIRVDAGSIESLSDGHAFSAAHIWGRIGCGLTAQIGKPGQEPDERTRDFGRIARLVRVV